MDAVAHDGVHADIPVQQEQVGLNAEIALARPIRGVGADYGVEGGLGAVEGGLRDGDILGQHDNAAQGGAVEEGVSADGGNAGGDDDARHRGVVDKGILADDDDVLGDPYGGGGAGVLDQHAVGVDDERGFFLVGFNGFGFVGDDGRFGGFADQLQAVGQFDRFIRNVQGDVRFNALDVQGRVEGHLRLGHGAEHAKEHQGYQQQCQHAIDRFHHVFLL